MTIVTFRELMLQVRLKNIGHAVCWFFMGIGSVAAVVAVFLWVL